MSESTEVRLVCIYMISTELGGTERSVLTLVQGLKEVKGAGFEPWVLLPKSTGPLLDLLLKNGIRFDVLDMPERTLKISRSESLVSFINALMSAPEMIIYLVKLQKLLRDKKPVLIYSNGLKCHFISAVLGWKTGTPVLWHLRDIYWSGPVLTALRSIQKMFSVKWAANSKATARAFCPGGTVIYNGLDPKIYYPEKNRKFNRQMNIDDSIPVIGIIGVLARWKGQIEFLKMAKKLIAEGSPAYFAVIGGEIYDTSGGRGFMDELKRETERLEIESRVLFAGQLADPAQAMNGLDLLVHASIRPEPFGRVVVEAMACGVPVIASAAGGVLEIVDDGETGILFEPGDVEDLTKKVRRVLADPELRSGLAVAGRQKYLEKFTDRSHVDAVIRLFQEALS